METKLCRRISHVGLYNVSDYATANIHGIASFVSINLTE
jgi:hypothetical protein